MLDWQVFAQTAAGAHHNSRLLDKKPTDPVWCVCHRGAGLSRSVKVSHGPTSVRLVAMHCRFLSYALWHSTRQHN